MYEVAGVRASQDASGGRYGRTATSFYVASAAAVLDNGGGLYGCRSPFEEIRNNVSASKRSRDTWSSGLIFGLVLTGATAGFGNFWRFPYLVGEHGGGAFLLVYLLCLLALGVPLLAAEILVGRRGRGSPVAAVARLSLQEGLWPSWRALGWLCLLSCCLLLATLSVVGGWALAYVFRAASGAFAELDALQAADLFQQLIRDPERLLAWHTLFLGFAMMVVARGVRWGLEEAAHWFVPMLFGLLLLLVGYTAAASGQSSDALRHMLWPRLGALGWESLLLAMRHAIYTLSLGLGVALTLGAYLDERVSILKASLLVAIADTALGILAGLMVFPVLFGAALLSSSGPELVFQAIPLALGQLPSGTWFGTLFFLLLVFAAWTSAIALLEPLVAYLMERRGLERPHATSYAGIVAWSLGVVALLSLSLWAHVRPLGRLDGFAESTLFDIMAFVAADLVLPVSSLALALLVGWRMSARSAELELGSGVGFRIWLVLIRYVVPLGLLVVLADGLGLFGFA